VVFHRGAGSGRIARGYRLGALTDDVVQTVWLRLAENCGRIREPERLAAWLATTTRNEALRGVSRRPSLEVLFAGRVSPEAQMREMMERKHRSSQALLTQVTPDDLLPGAHGLLQTLRAAGQKIALGSASKNAREVVQRLQIASCIDAIADGYSVVRPKPAPELFVYAAGLVGVYVDACVVFEDATVGVEAAKAAGMSAVGLGPVARVGQADLGLPDLSSVTLPAHLQRLALAHSGGQ
jgi:HAD superfamily hydrolase (TIGR01509 family)